MTDDYQVQSDDAQQQAPQDSGARSNDAVRQLIMQIGHLAQANPEAKQEFTAAATALTAASVKLVAGQQEPSPQQPVIGA